MGKVAAIRPLHSAKCASFKGKFCTCACCPAPYLRIALLSVGQRRRIAGEVHESASQFFRDRRNGRLRAHLGVMSTEVDSYAISLELQVPPPCFCFSRRFSLRTRSTNSKRNRPSLKGNKQRGQPHKSSTRSSSNSGAEPQPQQKEGSATAAAATAGAATAAAATAAQQQQPQQQRAQQQQPQQQRAQQQQPQQQRAQQQQPEQPRPQQQQQAQQPKPQQPQQQRPSRPSTAAAANSGAATAARSNSGSATAVAAAGPADSATAATTAAGPAGQQTQQQRPQQQHRPSSSNHSARSSRRSPGSTSKDGSTAAAGRGTVPGSRGRSKLAERPSHLGAAWRLWRYYIPMPASVSLRESTRVPDAQPLQPCTWVSALLVRRLFVHARGSPGRVLGSELVRYRHPTSL